MIRHVKAAVLCLLALATAAPECYADVVVQKPEFSVALPDGWVEMPQDALAAARDKIARTVPNAVIPRYDYGFQLAANKTMEYPYILVQLTDKGRIPPEQLQKLPKLDLGAALDGKTDVLKALVSGVSLGHMQYDEKVGVIWLSSQSEVPGVGTIHGLSGLIPTQNGALQLHCYALDASFDTYLPLFRQIVASATPSAALAYQPSPAAAHAPAPAPAAAGFDWRMALRRTALGVFIGGAAAWLLRIRSRKKPA
ncbi:hypothetical protein [Nevskia soli]|uniref:hypothetical protein n=1 Tax=Nevskia soli TaxID=418856 RepID=UPI0004A77723|nr:hypothetical protein [Nevskia soli]